MNTRAERSHLSRLFISMVAVLVLCLAVIPAPEVAWAQDTGWVITTDYSTFGQVRAFDLAQPWAVSADLATIPGDAVGRYHEGLIYIVGRGSANTLGVYDPAADFALVREFSLGAGRNPQDIAFAPDGTAFVSCYDSAELLAVDVQNGQVTATYSTAAFADADGLPETGWMAAVDDRLYIAAQLLDSANWYTPTGPGALLVFDMTARAWVDQDPVQDGVQPIALGGTDPYTRLQVFATGGVMHARVGCVGFFGVADGGIEEVDLDNGVSLGFVVTESDLGGDVTGFVQQGEVLYVLVSDASFITSVRPGWSPMPRSDTVGLICTNPRDRRTSTPGSKRNTSSIFRAPDASMSSRVTTVSVAGTSSGATPVRVAVTTTSNSSGSFVCSCAPSVPHSTTATITGSTLPQARSISRVPSLRPSTPSALGVTRLHEK